MLTIEKDPPKKVIFFALILITLTGSALRLYDLTYQSLWYDELHTVFRSIPEKNSIQSILDYAETSAVDQPPVFFLFTYFTFEVFGESEWVVRFGSAVLGILAIPIMFFLGRE